jgi:nitrate/nitrite-specific signal transduction histidine kinase
VTSQDELRILAEAFNGMVQGLKTVHGGCGKKAAEERKVKAYLEDTVRLMWRLWKRWPGAI